MSGTRNLRTPYVKPRTQNGTFYTFPSAMEDIGLNINESGNKVKLSHYVLLDIPQYSGNIASGTYSSQTLNNGDYTFADSIQNYMLNMETVIRNNGTYSFAESNTVSERCFWKWMNKNGFITFSKDGDSSYYTGGTNGPVKGFGYISAGSQRTDDYGIYNETFVQIPSSYGQMKVIFKKHQDSNFYAGIPAVSSSDNGYIENVDAEDIDSSGNLMTGVCGKAIYDNETEKSYSIDSSCGMEVVFDLNTLRDHYGDDYLTYDDLATNTALSPSGSYNFNSVLVYYSIYSSNGTSILATNAYGILVLNHAQTITNTDTYKIETLPKTRTTSTVSGTSYSFRINIKTTSVYGGNINVSDNSTPAYQMAEDFNDVIRNLSNAVSILRSNMNMLSSIQSDNAQLSNLCATAIDRIDDIEQTVNTISESGFDNIVSSSIDTDKLSVNEITGDVSFINGTTEYGNISGETLTYRNINVETSLYSENVSATKNLYSVNTILDEDIDYDEANEIIQSLECKTNGESYRIYADAQGEQSQKIVNSDGNIDMNSLMAVMLRYIKEQN